MRQIFQKIEEKHNKKSSLKVEEIKQSNKQTEKFRKRSTMYCCRLSLSLHVIHCTMPLVALKK